MIVVVAVHGGGVGRGVLQIAQPVVGVLQVALQREAVPRVAVGGLQEEVAVPLAVGRVPLVGESAHHRSGQSALRAVEVGVRREALVEASRLKAVEADVGVAPLAHGVLRSRLEAERIATVRALVFGIDEENVPEREVRLQLLQTERARAVLHVESGGVGSACLQIDRSRRSILRRRLQSLVAVGVVECHRLHVRERVASEVDLSVLRVGDAYAVEVHAHVLRAERPHIHGLQSAQSAVVLNLHAREILQRVGDRRGGQILQRSTGERLRGGEIMRTHAHNRHVPNRVYGVET